VSTRVFWPPGEAAQADYEMLRGCMLQAGCLIAWPAAEPVFRAELAGAARPPWTPGADPREQALAAAYQFLLDAVAALAGPGGQVGQGWS